MQRIGQLQSSRNAATRDSWSSFASHRESVTDLLLESAPPTKGTLCVLGAGNCNDVALKRLLDAFARIDLFDIDEAAMRLGITRQGVFLDKLTVQGGVDVTGVASLMSEWIPEVPATDVQVDACISSAVSSDPLLGAERYSVAASVCLLSQLIESISLTLGENHPRFLDLLTCVRREHLRRLTDLVVPGGTIVLITDVVSSLTVPRLVTCSPAELPTLLGRAISHRNFFSGMNPFVIKHLLETDELLATRVIDVRLHNPWVWDLGPRHYAVCALTARRVS